MAELLINKVKELKKGDKILYTTSTVTLLPVRVVSVTDEIIEIERQDGTPPGTVRCLVSYYSFINGVLLPTKMIK